MRPTCYRCVVFRIQPRLQGFLPTGIAKTLGTSGYGVAREIPRLENDR